MIRCTFLLLLIPVVLATYPQDGCRYCDVRGVRHQGNTEFTLTENDGCIEYQCRCKCDGGWDCPGTGKDICNTNPDTGCYYCEVDGTKFEGNNYFTYRNACIEYNCVCNCDGSWDCPGDKAKDLCRQNATSGCYYCEIDDYLYQGGSKFDLVRDCYKYSGCDCRCDGGWTCEHTKGESVCDFAGNEKLECDTCTIDGQQYRGNSMFHVKRDCIQYICTCDCLGRFFCPSVNAVNTCSDKTFDYIPSLSSGVYGVTERTRPPRQIETDCRRCYVDGNYYNGNTQFSRVIGCNKFTCNCFCNGQIDCPAESVNICGSTGVSGGSAGLDATSSSRGSYTVTGISRGSVSAIKPESGSSVNVCTQCEFLGVVYEGNAPFTFEKGCWQYNCFCNCDGGFNCPSNRSEYICSGREICVRCDVTDYDEGYKEPNTNFQIRNGCDLFERCRCNCDGGWSCEDGVYACEIQTGCMADGRRFASGKTFELTRGCTKFKDCICNDGGDWNCIGQDVEDLCGACRKCKIGDFYYDGNTQFAARVNCTSYKNCECNCDGSYECKGGTYTCDGRSDQPPDGQCTDCMIEGKLYRNWQSFDYSTRCATYRGCQCRCGQASCRRVQETCGDCRTCNVGGIDYAGGSVFSLKQGCYMYDQCTCNCDGKWSCPGENAVDQCNNCKKCNVNGTLYEAYTKFNLDRNCWNYQCFCLCNGTTWCPSATVVNTCTQPDRCLRCEVDGRDIRGNTHFKYDLNGIDMHCRCNCDGSHTCIAEWLYTRTDVSISGSGIGSGGSGCFSCEIDGVYYSGDTNYRITRSGINLDCSCKCDGSYACYGEANFAYQGCRECSAYGRSYSGDGEFPLVYNGLQLVCQCSCDSSYICMGANLQVVVQCDGFGGAGCLPEVCNQCIVDGVRFNGGDQFGTVFRGTNLRCDCGCDGSYYCEGTNGLIISCVGGRCVELGCSSCEVYGMMIEGGTAFEAYFKGLKLQCQCECGGNYQCQGGSGDLLVNCLDGQGCLTGQCRSCQANGRLVNGRTTFRYDYNGIPMLCTCACDGSYHCEGVTELIEISCVGGSCKRLGCDSCSVYGQVYEGDSSFDLVNSGLKLSCKCSCDSGYVCYGFTDEPPKVTCLGGRGRGCLPSTCSACSVNGREYAGRSNFRSVYKEVDVLCICGCDGSSYCAGITTSIEVSCIGGVCQRIGCKECSLFGTEYLGGSEFDLVYDGRKITCECNCEGGYICRSSIGVIIVTCVNGFGAGCLEQSCRQCLADGRRIDGNRNFQTVYQGINMECTCSCDSSYYCEGLVEEIAISCVGGTCTPVGCKTCRLFGNEYPGASIFDLVYVGLLLDCQCQCDGSYYCKGETSVNVLQCRDGRGDCVPQTCQSCLMEGKTYNGGSRYKYNYDGIDMECRCGCDGSVYCSGTSTEIILTCVGGKCSPIGCKTCPIFGSQYVTMTTFDLIFSGYKLRCRCNCDGSYKCEGSTNFECSANNVRDCLPQTTCGTCTLDGQQHAGKSVFKYEYNGIDMSCTCGCDSSIFCFGVTELIEIRCIGGSCTPQGCRNCNAFGQEYPSFSDFSVILKGVRMNCECSCDSSYICYGLTGNKVYTCDAGSDCLKEPCRPCVVNDRQYTYKDQFPHRYKDIPMTCACGCDGTSFCEGTETVIYVSCIGENCSPVDCQTCEIFGQQYQGDTNFDLIFKGTKMDCSCRCDTSYRCEGSSTDEVIDCKPGESCIPDKCKKCRVDGLRYDGGTTFQYMYENIQMNCVCGCDGSYYCRGVSVEIIIACQRRGGCRQIGGCRNCNIFGIEYPGGSNNSFVYQGYFMDCQCQCDSSYKCIGYKDEIITECSPGMECLTDCNTCIVDGREYSGNSKFDYNFQGKNMVCTCGCDGSYYCKCKDDGSEVSCSRSGDCTWIGCNTCMSDGRQRQAYEEFEKIYDGIRMNCLCSCDGSYRCQGVDRSIVIICNGDGCSVQGCRTCLVDGQEYSYNTQYEVRSGSQQKRCTCKCDGSSECVVVERPVCVSCTAGNGITYKGHSRNWDIRGDTRYICDCHCNGTLNCYVYKEDLSCSQCLIDNQRFDRNPSFLADVFGLRMQCSCSCDGSYRCTSDTKVCTSTGCVDNCRQCIIDNQRFDRNPSFNANVYGLRMQCSCSCDGSYRCTSETKICTSSGCVDNCRQCVIDNKQFDRNPSFNANVYGYRMTCSCACDGSYRCTSDTQICTKSGCVDNCRQCVIDNQRFDRNPSFPADVYGNRMTCSCSCDGSYRCTSDTQICTSTGCVDNCRQCVIDNQRFDRNPSFIADVFGNRMTCSCSCDGRHRCTSDTQICTSSGCVDNCRQCVIDNKQFDRNPSFNANVYGNRMTCSCACDGSYRCTSDTQVCTKSGCVDNCRQCVIDNQRFDRNPSFPADVFGNRMVCSCSCDGSYRCTSDTQICTSSGCVDNCRQCIIDNQQFDRNPSFLADVYGNRMTCSCSCDGSYRCTSDSQICTSSGCVDNCRQCVIDNKQFDRNPSFNANVYGYRMTCSCACDGSYRCTSDTQVCTKSGCVDNCRQCVIDNQRFDRNPSFPADVFGNRMVCSCSCDGSYRCTSDTQICTLSGCVDNCRQCVIDNQRFDRNPSFIADVFGNQMTCSCSCDGSYRCTSDTQVCTKSGCVDNCRQCVIDNQRFDRNPSFPADVFGNRMTCSCSCDGSYRCTSDTQICTSSGCVENCRQCVIDGQRFDQDLFIFADVYGQRMQCVCPCDGDFKCVSEDKICTPSGCVDNCRMCVIDNQRFDRNPSFLADVYGLRMQCSCSCNGSYRCTSDTQVCTSSGCVDNCKQCVIDNQRFDRNPSFLADVYGYRMQCSCSCDGSYRCTSDTQICTSTGCVDNCRQCVIDNQRFDRNPKFLADVYGYRMTCSCSCDGSYRCTSDTQVCTSTGCVDNCRQCLIDGRSYPRSLNFQADVFGYRMQCSCDCSGSFRCISDTRVCTETGCDDVCRSCYINGVRRNGNSNFNAILQGIQMQCSCDCIGNYECRGRQLICTQRGCESTNTCPGCLIEGKTYKGNSRFDIFYNAYDIDMTCDCECSGSYTCKGTKEVPICYGSGCTGTGCNNCEINNISYKGGTSFQALVDGYMMDCVCSCNGGYRCSGTRSQTSCYGTECPKNDNRCSDCVIRGTTYAGNSRFEIDGEAGVRMQCTCDCNGRYTCRGEKRSIICIGPGCDDTVDRCSGCLYEGRKYEGGSVFKTVNKDGVNMDCTCACGGEVRCEGTKVIECQGDQCGKGTLGCRRCVIDGRPYSGNTRFTFSKASLEYDCICFCDGSYNCKGSTGLETSCVGEDCAAEKCRNCKLFDTEFKLDARFRLQKNDLVMNCVCECDGAYRCFSVTGTCVGPECDFYGCKSCSVEGRSFPANTEFELSTGLTCTCECNGEYKCRAKSLQVECVGADCGTGGCRRCLVDNDYYAGNTRFQIRKYGLLMQCVCNCDSSFICRGYQIISTGQTEVDLGCKQCEIDGRKYNGNTRFQAMINGKRQECSCDCQGRHSCSDAVFTCRACLIGNQRYDSNKDFKLYKSGRSVQCRCDCSGNFVCQGQGVTGYTVGQACRECSILGSSYQGGQKFTAEANGVTMLCECFCSGEYVCKGYRQVTNVILPAVEETVCDTCYVAGTEHPGNERFALQRGCFQIECICNCDGTWQCPQQVPVYTCSGSPWVESGGKQQLFYSITGSVVYPGATYDQESRLIYTGGENVLSSSCRTCFINEQEYGGNTNFVLQDGCLRWTCSCGCDGAFNCTGVTGSECDGPLTPFEHKSCTECTAYGKKYPSNRRFTTSDECYQYSCMCNCDGSWECPKELTVKICDDATVIYSPERGTCRQCVLGTNKYDYGQQFELVDSCVQYRCTCNCDGSYHCPGSSSVRVCRTGSGAAGRPVTTGSNTISETRRTVVAIRPSGFGSRDTYSETQGQNQNEFTSELYGSGSSGTISSGTKTAVIGKGHSSSSSVPSYNTGSSSGISYNPGSSSGYVYGVDSASSGSYSSGSVSGTSYNTGSSSGTSYDTGSSSGYVYGVESVPSGSYSSGSSSGTSYSVDSSTGKGHGSSSKLASYDTGSSSSYSYSVDSSSAGSFHEDSSSGGHGGSSYSHSVVASDSSLSTNEGSELLASSSCQPCTVNGQTLKGGRDFTYKAGCWENLCECFCNGTHFCDPDKRINFCEIDRLRHSSRNGQECVVKNRTYKTKLFSYEDKCKKYYCRCYSNGEYICDESKTRTIC